jgi:protein TonB
MNPAAEFPAGGGFAPVGLVAVLALHAAVFWTLLLLRVGTIDAPAPPSVLTVALLKPPEVAVPPPVPPPTAPLPKPRLAPPPERIAAPVEALAVPPAPTFAEPAPPAPPTPPPPVVVPAPPQTVAPRFDAAYLENPKPPYPALSRRLGEEGRVVLRVRVRADGTAGETAVETSSGSPRLDRAALDTVSRWKFVPARRGDEPVAAWVRVPIVFSLKE